MNNYIPPIALFAIILLYLVWQSQTAVAQPTTATPPQTAVSGITGINALYAVGGHWQTGGWHGLAGWQGVDWKAGCGTPLYAPIDGVVTYAGADGYVGPHARTYHPVYGRQNSMVTISGAAEEWTLIHLDIAVRLGQQVQAGRTYIGDEASIGNSTGCHTHIVKKVDGRPVRPH